MKLLITCSTVYDDDSEKKAICLDEAEAEGREIKEMSEIEDKTSYDYEGTAEGESADDACPSIQTCNLINSFINVLIWTVLIVLVDFWPQIPKMEDC